MQPFEEKKKKYINHVDIFFSPHQGTVIYSIMSEFFKSKITYRTFQTVTKKKKK